MPPSPVTHCKVTHKEGYPSELILNSDLMKADCFATSILVTSFRTRFEILHRVRQWYHRARRQI